MLGFCPEVCTIFEIIEYLGHNGIINFFYKANKASNSKEAVPKKKLKWASAKVGVKYTTVTQYHHPIHIHFCNLFLKLPPPLVQRPEKYRI